jgi:hypothetical protein
MVLAVDVPGYNVEVSSADGLKVVQKPVPPTPLWLQILKAAAIVLLLVVCVVLLFVGTCMYRKKRSAMTTSTAPGLSASSYGRR